MTITETLVSAIVLIVVVVAAGYIYLVLARKMSVWLMRRFGL